jgi:hypothetical protein
MSVGVVSAGAKQYFCPGCTLVMAAYYRPSYLLIEDNSRFVPGGYLKHGVYFIIIVTAILCCACVCVWCVCVVHVFVRARACVCVCVCVWSPY